MARLDAVIVSSVFGRDMLVLVTVETRAGLRERWAGWVVLRTSLALFA